MKRVAIVGGGFAGLAAAARLARAATVGVLLLDKRETHQHLPAAPEVVGFDMPPSALCYPLADAARRWGFAYRNATVKGIDFDSRRVITEAESVPFDYVLIATGAQTDLRHLSSRGDLMLTLDSVEDARRLRVEALTGDSSAYVVAGGGHKGVAIATQLKRRLLLAGRDRPVVLLNRGDRTCRGLPGLFSDYIDENLAELDIDVRHETWVRGVTRAGINLSTGETMNEARLVWTAGVQPPPLVRYLSLEKTVDGRLMPDVTLRVSETGFVAGDAAGFVHRGKPLRRGAWLAVRQGRHAAGNMLRLIAGRRLTAYSPFDPGCILAMANSRGCGRMFGVNWYGWSARWLHHLLCLGYSPNFANKARLLRAIISSEPFDPDQLEAGD